MNNEHKYFQFNGKGWPLFKLFLANYFLTIITFGIYFFWAKVRYRRFFYYHTIFNNGNFDFHVTGKELFILFLKSILVIIPAITGISGFVYFLFKSGMDLRIIAGIVLFIFYCGIFTLIPLAVYETRKFMLERTSWNLKYFSFNARLKSLYKIYLKGFLLSIITFGIYSFWFRVNIKKYLTNYTSIDNQYFSYRGRGKDIFLMTLLAMLLTPLTFGFYLFWFIAKYERYQWSHTFFNHTRFQSTITGGRLLKVLFLNFLQIIFTLGIGLPWALIRQKKYIIESLVLTDQVEYEEFLPEEIPVKEEKKSKLNTREEFPEPKKPDLEDEIREEKSNEFRERYGDFFD